MRIEKRNVGYWIQIVLMALAAIGIIGLSVFFIINKGEYVSYDGAMKDIIENAVIWIAGGVILIAMVIFLILKKVKVFSILFIGYLFFVIASFMEPFMRLDIFFFDIKNPIVQILIWALTIFAIVIAIPVVWLLLGLFSKKTKKVLFIIIGTLSAILLAFAIAMVIIGVPYEDSFKYDCYKHLITCGMVSLVNTLICWAFLAQVYKQVEEDPVTVVNPSVEEQQYREPDTRYCPKCGFQTKITASFCASCGSILPPMQNVTVQQNMPAKPKKKTGIKFLKLVSVIVVSSIAVVIGFFYFKVPTVDTIEVENTNITINTLDSSNDENVIKPELYGNDKKVNFWYGKDIEYKSKDTDVATVEKLDNSLTAEVTAKDEGECDIIVKCGSESKKVKVEVEKSLEYLYDLYCDSEYAELDDDGKTLKIEIDVFGVNESDSVEAASNVANALGFEYGIKYMKPDDWSGYDYGTEYSDTIDAECEWEYYYYKYSETADYTLEFSVD